MNTTHISHVPRQVTGNCRFFKLGQNSCVWADPAPLPHTELCMCVPCREQQPARKKCIQAPLGGVGVDCQLCTIIEVHFVFYFPCWFSVWRAKIHTREGTPPWQQELLRLSACADWDHGTAQLLPGAMQVVVGVHVCSSQGSLYLLVQKCKNIWW